MRKVRKKSDMMVSCWVDGKEFSKVRRVVDVSVDLKDLKAKKLDIQGDEQKVGAMAAVSVLLMVEKTVARTAVEKAYGPVVLMAFLKEVKLAVEMVVSSADAMAANLGIFELADYSAVSMVDEPVEQ